MPKQAIETETAVINNQDPSTIGGNDLVKEFVTVTKEKRRLDKIVKAMGARLEELMPFIQKYYDENGIDKLTLMGMTVYPQEEFSISTKEETRIRLMEYIVENAGNEQVALDLEYMMNLNSRSLSAYFKELFKYSVQENPNLQIKDIIPEKLVDMLNVSTTIKIRARAK